MKRTIFNFVRYNRICRMAWKTVTDTFIHDLDFFWLFNLDLKYQILYKRKVVEYKKEIDAAKMFVYITLEKP